MFRLQDVVYDDLPISSFWIDMRLEHPHITVGIFCLPILRSNYEINPLVSGLLLQTRVDSPEMYYRCGYLVLAPLSPVTLSSSSLQTQITFWLPYNQDSFVVTIFIPAFHVYIYN
jgi:hypothetical protein